MDSIRKVVAGELRGAVALLMLLAVAFGAANRWAHKVCARVSVCATLCVCMY